MTDSTNDASGDRMGNIPRYALFRGKRVRIIDYENNRFTILERDDSRRTVIRSQLTFLK